GNVEKIELLPYHELGKHKWVAMGEEYKLDGVKPPKKETMERVAALSTRLRISSFSSRLILCSGSRVV
ncbi:hypothetical protein MJM95_29510, partial [Salmonella enterica subsp. enterica serovar Anatum]|nr:hypothetical protein [Salmonella enterica subsp. enterica serovar Anatum]